MKLIVSKHTYFVICVGACLTVSAVISHVRFFVVSQPKVQQKNTITGVASGKRNSLVVTEAVARTTSRLTVSSFQRILYTVPNFSTLPAAVVHSSCSGGDNLLHVITGHLVKCDQNQPIDTVEQLTRQENLKVFAKPSTSAPFVFRSFWSTR